MVTAVTRFTGTIKTATEKASQNRPFLPAIPNRNLHKNRKTNKKGLNRLQRCIKQKLLKAGNFLFKNFTAEVEASLMVGASFELPTQNS